MILGIKLKNKYHSIFSLNRLGTWRPHIPYLSVLLQTIYYMTQEAVASTTTGVGEDSGKKEPSYTVGGNVN
jgi:hypothetical protein